MFSWGTLQGLLITTGTKLFEDLRHLEAMGYPLPRQVYFIWADGRNDSRGGKWKPEDNTPSRMGRLQWDTRPEAFPHPEETIKWLKDSRH